MDCIVNELDPACGPFFDRFADLWSRPSQQQGFSAYVRGLLAQVDRKNVEAISSRTVEQPYQGLHHFLTESPWDASELNRRRIALMQAEPRTRSRRTGSDYLFRPKASLTNPPHPHPPTKTIRQG